jgi:hypothetical protein
MDQLITGPLTDAAEVVTLNKDDALAKFNEYKAALRVSRSQHDRMMKAVYGALSEGLGVINPRAAILKAGLDANHYPKIAICRADFQTVFFRRLNNEQDAFFSSFSGKYLSGLHKTAQSTRLQFHFPAATLPGVEPKIIPRHNVKGEFLWNDRQFPKGYFETVKATVPIIPPAHRPGDHSLNQYCILWEVEKWEALPKPPRPPGDPMLLKPLAQTGLYAVMAHWDLTEIEKMVLGAMYGN